MNTRLGQDENSLTRASDCCWKALGLNNGTEWDKVYGQGLNPDNALWRVRGQALDSQRHSPFEVLISAIQNDRERFGKNRLDYWEGLETGLILMAGLLADPNGRVKQSRKWKPRSVPARWIHFIVFLLAAVRSRRALQGFRRARDTGTPGSQAPVSTSRAGQTRPVPDL